MGCKFCHLTEFGETSFQHATVEDYALQLQTIMDYVDKLEDKHKITRVNINYMSRGDALANKTILNNFNYWHHVAEDIIGNKYEMRHNVSTIFPHAMQDRNLYDIFNDKPVQIYYSLYSHILVEI